MAMSANVVVAWLAEPNTEGRQQQRPNAKHADRVADGLELRTESVLRRAAVSRAQYCSRRKSRRLDDRQSSRIPVLEARVVEALLERFEPVLSPEVALAFGDRQ
jgi:hypothetical protein